MSVRLGIVVSAAVFLVAACGGSERGAPREVKAATFDNTEICQKLGTEWAVASDDKHGPLMRGEQKDISQTQAVLVGQARKMQSEGCKQDYVQEVLKGNAGVESVQVELAKCLHEHGQAVEAGTEFCVEAGTLWDVKVVPHVERVRDLIAKEIDPSAKTLSLREACFELSKALPANLQRLDRNTQVMVLGDVSAIHGRADARTRDILSRLMFYVSGLATGYDPPSMRQSYPQVLRTAQRDCKKVGIKLVPSRLIK